MTSGESKKLTIAIWALTIVITISTIIQVAAVYAIPEIVSEVEQVFDDSEISSQFKEHYLKNEIAVLRAKVTNRISTHPNDEYSYYYLGLILYKEGVFEQAYLNFKKASELDPTWESALNYMDLSVNR